MFDLKGDAQKHVIMRHIFGPAGKLAFGSSMGKDLGLSNIVLRLKKMKCVLWEVGESKVVPSAWKGLSSL